GRRRKDNNFFPSVQGTGDFPLSLPEKNSFCSLSFISKSCVSYWNLPMQNLHLIIAIERIAQCVVF
ncbi:MAG: hypothetical protein IJQ89_04420, partial [Bacteroidales bacterium]|nr:hypothetical protein [Bacteroidales bacterium]